MKKTKLIGFISILSALFLIGCADGSQNTSNSTTISRNSLSGANTSSMNSAMNSNTANSNSMMNLNGTDTASSQDTFWTKAAQGGIAEVELSRVAAAKSQNADVKNYAQKMITDHTKANDELKTLAAKKNVTLPTETDAAHKAKLQELQNLSGAEFDREYVNTMVDDHQKTVDLFEKQSNDNSDPDLKAFAAKTLPTLKSHLDMIKNIQGKMK